MINPFKYQTLKKTEKKKRNNVSPFLLHSLMIKYKPCEKRLLKQDRTGFLGDRTGSVCWEFSESRNRRTWPGLSKDRTESVSWAFMQVIIDRPNRVLGLEAYIPISQLKSLGYENTRPGPSSCAYFSSLERGKSINETQRD